MRAPATWGWPSVLTMSEFSFGSVTLFGFSCWLHYPICGCVGNWQRKLQAWHSILVFDAVQWLAWRCSLCGQQSDTGSIKMGNNDERSVWKTLVQGEGATLHRCVGGQGCGECWIQDETANSPTTPLPRWPRSMCT
jgi:hypothetical protein